jgi:hypothetical protein
MGEAVMPVQAQGGGMESRVGAKRKRGKRPCKRSCSTGDGCGREADVSETPLRSGGGWEWGRQTKWEGSGAMIRTDYETRAASIGFTP